MRDIKIKVCGIRNIDIANHCVLEGAQFLGFVFYENSPRYVSLKSAGKILSHLNNLVQKVAVLKDPSDELVLSVADLPFDYLQIHGSISLPRLEIIKNLSRGKKIIKAFNVKDRNDINKLKTFENICEFYLFDSQSSGSGNTFNWDILKNVDIGKDYFISGGINIENIGDASNKINTNFWDLSSGLEVEKGVKDKKLITNFFKSIRKL